MLVHKKQEVHEYEQRTASPAPKIVRKADKRLRIKCLTLVVIAAVMAAVTTIQSAAIVQAGYDLVKAKSQVAKMEKENELLRLDIAKLKSPQRIEEYATKELGMVVPKNAYYATTVKPENTQQQPAPVVSNDGVADKMLNAIGVNKAEASKGR
ncbi:cell division protein FtsL [Sporomusa acidovorans]|uniref:Cell division protein FtsL n=1 Tax=Sporomusa acidovorans (strain ATCC 49682 / DSM 3132 / Mol) TaxID=1123286 RepID=A0ABZ3J1P9_SPOA4|nr:cell division protein FtsL [Sporomusa acidovorans]OZC13599.1 cell division protein FtsL [Sporomusa acidovorans DSM 3132]SDE87102.1 cell division protein FtsL [Sporomusa acidovorans]